MIEHCTVKEFCRRHGIGRSTFYKLVRRGSLRVVKLGSRTLIPSDSEREWCLDLAAIAPIASPAYAEAYVSDTTGGDHVRPALPPGWHGKP